MSVFKKKSKKEEPSQPRGGRNALKTDKARREAFKSYCEYVSSGKSRMGWFWCNEEGEYANFEIMERAIHKDPEFFKYQKYLESKSKNFRTWEDRGEHLRREKESKSNVVYWQINMRNRFGWDRPVKDDKGSVSVTIKDEKVT